MMQLTLSGVLGDIWLAECEKSGWQESETQEAGLTAHFLFDNCSVEDKWAHEAHSRVVAAALSRVHE